MAGGGFRQASGARRTTAFPRPVHERWPLARAGDAGPLWVTAGEQTEGRGRRGRAWMTGGGNLAASLLLVDPARAGACRDHLLRRRRCAPPGGRSDCAGPGIAERLKLKWPNDLLLDRRKVAGILVEGES